MSTHVKPGERAEIAALYRTGNYSIEDLCKKTKRSKVTIMRIIKEEGAVKGSAAAKTKEKVTEKIERSILNEAEIIANRVRETKDEHYKMSAAIAKITYKTVADAARANKAMATIVNDLKALKSAAEIIEITRKTRYTTLGINDEKGDDDDELPALMIQELTAEQIEEMNRLAAQQAQQEAGEDFDADDFGVDELDELDQALDRGELDGV